jgi:hypothetical protein
MVTKGHTEKFGKSIVFIDTSITCPAISNIAGSNSCLIGYVRFANSLGNVENSILRFVENAENDCLLPFSINLHRQYGLLIVATNLLAYPPIPEVILL